MLPRLSVAWSVVEYPFISLVCVMRRDMVRAGQPREETRSQRASKVHAIFKAQ